MAELQPLTQEALGGYESSVAAFATERHAMLGRLATGALVTVEYTNDRPITGPGRSNVRVIGSVGGTAEITGNASLTFYDETPAGATRQLRDFQLSGQMDLRLGSSESVGAFAVSIAGQYIRQLDDTIDASGFVVPDTKGTIATGQFKLTVPLKETGIKIPVSITFANRTDLIKEKIVRGNVGVTFDLDSAFARFKP
jgi:hypothetical protein